MLGPTGHWLIHFGSGRDFHRPCYQNLVLDTIAGKQTILKFNCVNYLWYYIYRFSGSGLRQGMGGILYSMLSGFTMGKSQRPGRVWWLGTEIVRKFLSSRAWPLGWNDLNTGLSRIVNQCLHESSPQNVFSLKLGSLSIAELLQRQLTAPVYGFPWTRQKPHCLLWPSFGNQTMLPSYILPVEVDISLSSFAGRGHPAHILIGKMFYFS